jgi:uncharacterized membrane protein
MEIDSITDGLTVWTDKGMAYAGSLSMVQVFCIVIVLIIFILMYVISKENSKYSNRSSKWRRG